jgi:signal transduction histidine kinase
LDAGQFVTQRSLVDLPSLISTAVQQVRASTDRHEIQVVAPDVVAAHLDGLRIEQVVGNLLDNAIKFSPDGGRIDVELSAMPDGLARLAVRDYGIGIPPDRRANLFSRYYQAHAESHRSGLGMGLYISRRIVEHHGGWIEVEFPPDAGTRFVVYLPSGLNGANDGVFLEQRREIG